MTALPPPTNYYGGKTRQAPWIASLLPAHRTYVEPFAGSAAVLFAKRPSPTEILNYLDGQVVNFFRVLRERPAELHRALALTPFARAEYQQLAAGCDAPGLDELERARRWFVRVNQSISHLAGRGRPSGWAAAAYNTNGADHAHKFVALTDRLQGCAQRLRRVHLQCRPAVEVIAKYAKPGAAAALYCDPPYLASTRSAQAQPAGLDYAVEYASEAEHHALAEVLHATSAAVLLSGYPSGLYEELYASWWRLERTVQRPTSNVSGGRGTVATEVIWSNRPLTHQARLGEPEAVVGP